jgi:FKBP-type peptidyl-prolyl cis-trans isomerase 2
MTTIHTIQNVTGPTVTIAVPPEFAGQQVAIEIKVIAKKTEPWGEGLKRCAGALADEWTNEDDRILEEIYQDRKRANRREIPE